MKKLSLALFVLFLFAGAGFSQEMGLPPAVDNKLLNALPGDWVSEPYDFMGMKWQDEVNIKWILNNQFLELTGVTKMVDGGFSFGVLSLMTADKDGNFKSWGFDDWGMMNTGEFTGKIDGMKLTMEGGGEFMKGKGMFEIKDGKLYQEFTFTMKDMQTGQDVTQTMKLIYNKK